MCLPTRHCIVGLCCFFLPSLVSGPVKRKMQNSSSWTICAWQKRSSSTDKPPRDCFRCRYANFYCRDNAREEKVRTKRHWLLTDRLQHFCDVDFCRLLKFPCFIFNLSSFPLPTLFPFLHTLASVSNDNWRKSSGHIIPGVQHLFWWILSAC